VEATISIEHLTQFVQLWALIQHVHLNVDEEDDITWKLTTCEVSVLHFDSCLFKHLDFVNKMAT
jgi:hypothetical protein